MIIVTTNEIADRNIVLVKGLVTGSTVQSKHIGRDFGAGLKQLVGGEIRGYSELMAEAREIATKRIISEAKELGANAIIGTRYQTAQIMDGAAEVLVYGTAVMVD